jgi:hypothetical protein
MFKWETGICYSCHTLSDAVHRNHLSCLAQVHQQQLHPDLTLEMTVEAAGHGNVEMVKWMREQNPPCPWDARVLKAATYSGGQHMLDYLLKHECPNTFLPLSSSSISECSEENGEETFDEEEDLFISEEEESFNDEEEVDFWNDVLPKREIVSLPYWNKFCSKEMVSPICKKWERMIDAL